jgi:hypothetical protein
MAYDALTAGAEDVGEDALIQRLKKFLEIYLC